MLVFSAVGRMTFQATARIDSSRFHASNRSARETTCFASAAGGCGLLSPDPAAATCSASAAVGTGHRQIRALPTTRRGAARAAVGEDGGRRGC